MQGLYNRVGGTDASGAKIKADMVCGETERGIMLTRRVHNFSTRTRTRIYAYKYAPHALHRTRTRTHAHTDSHGCLKVMGQSTRLALYLSVVLRRLGCRALAHGDDRRVQEDTERGQVYKSKRAME